MYCNSIIHSACIVIVLVVVGRTFGLGDTNWLGTTWVV